MLRQVRPRGDVTKTKALSSSCTSLSTSVVWFLTIAKWLLWLRASWLLQHPEQEIKRQMSKEVALPEGDFAKASGTLGSSKQGGGEVGRGGAKHI